MAGQRRAHRGQGVTGSIARLKRYPAAPWAGAAIVALALLALPFALAAVGTTWVRITNLAILFVFLSLGLNIVVGFAGLLDLGYVAFYALGALTVGWLGSGFAYQINHQKGVHVGVSSQLGGPGLHLNFLPRRIRLRRQHGRRCRSNLKSACNR